MKTLFCTRELSAVVAAECDRVKSLFTPASWLLAGSDRVKSLSEPTSFLPAGLTYLLISLVPTPVSAAPKSLFVRAGVRIARAHARVAPESSCLHVTGVLRNREALLHVLV